MTSEQDKYFRHFKPENVQLPNVSWEEMIDRKVVFGPTLLRKVLSEANDYLTTAEGPNLERRKVIVPPWFDYWRDLLVFTPEWTEEGLIDSGNKLQYFENIKEILSLQPNKTSGGLFVAAAEGHAGHIHAAEYMSGEVDVVVWGFEQESYMLGKPRGGSFLPLEVRLSMWFYMKNIDILTVIPEIDEGTGVNEHYDSLFEQLGIDVMFYDENDPYAELKSRRKSERILTLGQQRLVDDLVDYLDEEEDSVAISRLMPSPSIGDIIDAKIRHFGTSNTSNMTKRLMSDDIDLRDLLPIKQMEEAHMNLKLSDSIFMV